jgi:hypothetical protein
LHQVTNESSVTAFGGPPIRRLHVLALKAP